MVSQSIYNAASLWGDKMRSSVQLVTDQAGQDFARTPDRYELNEAYYANAAYEQATRGTVNRRNLPRNIRSVLALIKPAVDWWPAHLYPGVWTRDGLPSGNGRDNRIAYDDGTPEEIRLATQIAFGPGWGAWHKDILTYALQAAMLGDTFATVDVDWERNKVYPRLHHPRYVKSLEFNNSSDLIMYHLEYPQMDEHHLRYTWGMRVDKETVRTFRNDEPYGYDGEPEVIPNQWGFVPAVWTQFRDVGGQHGASVMDGLHPVIDELNGMQSAADDFIIRFVRQQIMVSSKDPKGLARQLKPGTSETDLSIKYDDFLADVKRRLLGAQHDDEILVQPAPEGATAFRMLQNLGLAESDIHFTRILQVLERNLPEVVLSEKLLGMTHVTAPGVRPLIQDVQHKLDDVSANTDGGIVKLAQMCLSIGGELANRGQWGNRRSLTQQQQTFLPFDLSSWDQGDLDFSIQPRDLLRPTTLDMANEAKIIEGLSTPWALGHAGLGPEEIWGVNPATGEPNPGTQNGILADMQSSSQVSSAASLLNFNAGRVPAANQGKPMDQQMNGGAMPMKGM